MIGPKIAKGTAILLSLSKMNRRVERRSITRRAKNPASMKNSGMRQVWMKMATLPSNGDWFASVGQNSAMSAPPAQYVDHDPQGHSERPQTVQAMVPDVGLDR